MIKIAICDDKAQDREEIMKCCQRYVREKKFECQLSEYSSGEQVLSKIDADILLLDVEMGDIDGVQVKDILQRQKSNVSILFISSHMETLPQAFGRQVYGFLCKPIDYELFQEKMDFMMEDILEQNRYVCCEVSGSLRKIFVNEIKYIQAHGKYTKLFLEKEQDYVFSDKNIGAWREELGTYGFGMCHRSFLVNYNYVEKIDGKVRISGKQYLPVSRRMEKAFTEAYKEYIWGKAK